ncbi:MAG: HPF/RaiA family ribosome-associated protein [Gammaproteobacteria bacterium]|jgi:ribosome-associated translation inhibitor RaiA
MMQIDIHAPNFPLPDALRSHIEQRLDFALSARDDHIQRVLVWLSDINGPRGGTDKCCHIEVVLTRDADVVIKNTEADLYVAIDRAADGAARAVGCLVRQPVTPARNHEWYEW